MGRNYIINPSSFQNINNVTVANSATVARNTTTPLTAVSDFSITMPNNATGTVTWATNTLDNALNGQNCELRFDYTASSIGSNVVAQVLQGSSVIAVSAALSLATTAKTVSVNAACGSLASATTIVLANGTGNTGTSAINMANITYGRATNLTQAFQATDWIAYTLAVGAPTTAPTYGTIVSNQAMWRRVGDTMEIQWNFQQSSAGTSGSGVYLFPLPSGYTIDTTKATLATTLGSSSTGALTAGGNTVGHGTILTTVTSDTASELTTDLVIYNSTNLAMNHITATGTHKSEVGSNDPGWANSMMYVSFFARVPITGWTSTGAGIQTTQTPASWSGYHNGITGGCQNNSTTFADVSACTGITLTQTTNRNFGTVTTASGSLPGITFTPPATGMYEVCATASIGASGTEYNEAMRMVDGSSTVINAGVEWVPASTNQLINPLTACGIYNITTLASTTIKLQGATSSGSGTFQIGYVGAPQVFPSGSAQITWSIFQLDAPMPSPYLTGSVTSTSSGAVRLASAYIANNGTATITRQDGTWIQSASTAGSGSITLDITGAFSSVPNCTVTSFSASSNYNSRISTLTNTSIVIQDAVSGTGTNGDVMIICVGPR